MKQYKQLVNEIAFLKRILDDYKSKQELYKALEIMDEKYPGVSHFLFMASKWAHEVSPELNADLYNLLVKLSGKESITDFSEEDIRLIYKYIIKNKRYLKTFEDYEAHFIEATDD